MLKSTLLLTVVLVSRYLHFIYTILLLSWVLFTTSIIYPFTSVNTTIPVILWHTILTDDQRSPPVFSFHLQLSVLTLFVPDRGGALALRIFLSLLTLRPNFVYVAYGILQKSFATAGDLKQIFEKQSRKDEMTKMRKEELGRFRQMLCAVRPALPLVSITLFNF